MVEGSMIDLEKESTELVAKIVSEFARERQITSIMLLEVMSVIVTSYLQGKIDGLTAYAWWKDGTQFVGTCGTTLTQALEDAQKDASNVLRNTF